MNKYDLATETKEIILKTIGLIIILPQRFAAGWTRAKEISQLGQQL